MTKFKNMIVIIGFVLASSCITNPEEHTPVSIPNESRSLTKIDLSDHGYIHISPDGAGFIFDDGTRFIPNGFATGRIVSIAGYAGFNESTGRSISYEEFTDMLKANGINHIRLIIDYLIEGENEINPNGQTLEEVKSKWTPRIGNYNEEVISRMDRLLSLFEKKGIYVTVTLFHTGDLYGNTGGISLWNINPYNKKIGGVIASPDNFWTDASAREYFKKRMKFIIDRWGKSKNIFRWEIANEVNWRDGSSTTSPNRIVWTKEMAEFVRSNDPYKHPISVSVTSQTDALSDLWKYVDIIDIHGYNEPPLTPAQVRDAIRLHQKNWKKPVMLGEFGKGSDSFNPKTYESPPYLWSRKYIWAGFIASGASPVHWTDSSALKLTRNSYFPKFEEMPPVYLPISKFSDKVAWDRWQYPQGWENRISINGNVISIVATGDGDQLMMYIDGTGRVYLNVKGLKDGNYVINYFDWMSGDIVETKYDAPSNNSLNFDVDLENVAIISIEKID